MTLTTASIRQTRCLKAGTEHLPILQAQAAALVAPQAA